MLNLAMS